MGYPRGLPQTEESKQRRRESALRRYSRLSVEERRQLSRVWTDDSRARFSERMRELSTTPTWRSAVSRGVSEYLRGLSPEELQEWIGRAWEALGTRPTCLEVTVAAALSEFKVPFATQVSIGRYRVDFLVDETLVIECDGAYWHSLPEDREHDRVRDEWLVARGYVVTRLSEQQIKTDCASAVAHALDSRR